MSDAQAQPPLVQTQSQNGLAIAGFVCSLLGLLGTAGLLSPVGLILSLIALGRQPKGFAVAGVIIGLIGTCGGLILVILVAIGGLAAIGLATAVALSEPEKTELTADGALITTAVESRKAETGVYPESIDDLDVVGPFLVDPWGSAYRYELDAERSGYRILSNGPDGLPDTEDDINVRDLPQIWQEDLEPPSTPPEGGDEAEPEGEP